MRLVLIALALMTLRPLAAQDATPTAFTIERVNVATDGREADAQAAYPRLSDDGRIVTFVTAAANLVANDSNEAFDVFIRDRVNGTTISPSVPLEAPEDGWRMTLDHAFSGDGRWVIFESSALQTHAPVGYDLFAYDMNEESTTRLNSEYANKPYRSINVSADGRWIVFTSDANNLVEGDTNTCPLYLEVGSCPDVFLLDRETGDTSRISMGFDGTQANAPSFGAMISLDGSTILFSSDASNLVSDDTNASTDVFVYERVAGVLSRVSLGADGQEAEESLSGSYGGTMTPDGKVIAFTSAASNLSAGDTNGRSDAFVRNLTTGETTRVSLATDGSEGNHNSFNPQISADGRRVVFVSAATNFMLEDTNFGWDIFMHDLDSGTTTLVSQAADGTPGNAGSETPVLSPDGHLAAFVSRADNLVSGDTNQAADVFVVWLP